MDKIYCKYNNNLFVFFNFLIEIGQFDYGNIHFLFSVLCCIRYFNTTAIHAFKSKLL